MNYFLEYQKTFFREGERYFSFRLYSGTSLNELKDLVQDSLRMDGLGFYLTRIKPSLEQIIEMGEKLHDGFKMSQPHTDPLKAFDFYLKFLKLYKEGESLDFYFIGPWASEHRKNFVYFKEFCDELKIDPNPDNLSKIFSQLL